MVNNLNMTLKLVFQYNIINLRNMRVNCNRIFHIRKWLKFYNYRLLLLLFLLKRSKNIYTHFIINQMLCKCLTNTNYNLRIINNHCFKENNKYQIKYIQVNIYHNVYLFLPPIIVFKTTRDSHEERERER